MKTEEITICKMYLEDLDKHHDCNEYKLLMGLLEQEPCEDCVSRQAVLDQTYLWSKDEFLRVTNPFDYLRKRINSISPVTPEPKIGHWIYIGQSEINGLKICKCSECGKRTYGSLDYCGNCGAKMVEPKGSEG